MCPYLQVVDAINGFVRRGRETGQDDLVARGRHGERDSARPRRTLRVDRGRNKCDESGHEEQRRGRPKAKKHRRPAASDCRIRRRRNRFFLPGSFNLPNVIVESEPDRKTARRRRGGRGFYGRGPDQRVL